MTNQKNERTEYSMIIFAAAVNIVIVRDTVMKPKQTRYWETIMPGMVTVALSAYVLCVIYIYFLYDHNIIWYERI